MAKQNLNVKLVRDSAKFDNEVALGLVRGISYTDRACRNENIGTSFEDLWTAQGTKVYPTAETTLSIVSDNANDNISGDGARVVEVYYLDGDFKSRVEAIEMNGTTPVTSITDCFRFDRAEVVNSGSGDGSVGTISFSTDGDPQGLILPSKRITNTSQFTTPADHWCLISGAVFSVERNDRVRIEMEIRDVESGRDFKTVDYYLIYQRNLVLDLDLPIVVIPPKHDFRVRVVAENNNSIMFADLQILTVNEKEYLP